MSQNLFSQIRDLEFRISRRNDELDQELRRIPAAKTLYHHYVDGELVGCSTRPHPGYVPEEISLEQATREHRTKIRALRCSLTRLNRRLEQTEALDRQQNPFRYSPDMSKFAIKDVTVSQNESCVWSAYWKGRLIGRLVLNTFPEPEHQPNQRCVFKVCVEELYRRRGVGRLLYGKAEEYCTIHGHEFVPSPKRVLSDDGFEFWKRYRPEAVRDDARHWAGQYLGKIVRLDDCDWKLTSIMGVLSKMGFMGQRTDGTTRYISGPTVFALLGAPILPEN
jgi:GNAT superfamily N-acetyltransferase